MPNSKVSSTQEHLPIAGIQDGAVIMNDGSLRAIMRVDPINFELKSETEQNSIIYQYQAFLNSLDFPIEIVIHSKKLDLQNYLLKLEALQKRMTNDLLRIQSEDYIEYVCRLISIANIMSKRFYLVVSYAAVTKSTTIAGFANLFHQRATGPLLDQEQFTHFRTELFNRANLTAGSLSQLGVKVSLLNTQQLIELFYTIYNPDIAAEERLTDIQEVSAEVVGRLLDEPLPGDSPNQTNLPPSQPRP